MNNIKIKAYGKVNLSLDVTGVRNDGYHVIRTVMQKISLHDDVDVTWTPSKTDKIEISLGACFCEASEEVSFDQLYRKANRAMYQSKKQKGCSAVIYGEEM